MPRGYAETYRRSIDRPEEFWAEAAEAIDWEKRWDRVLDDTNPPFYRWFADGRLNTCWNAVDRHVAAGRGDQVALIWDSPVTGQIVRFTYRELRDEVARLAGVLAGLGVVKGDRVLIYMPMVPEAAFAMLACARIGAIHSVVFGGFAAHELAPGSTTPSRGSSCRPRAASRSTGSSPTSRCSMPRSPRRGPNPSIASFCSGQCAVPTWWRAATGIGMSSLPLPGLLTAFRSWRPTRSTSFTSRARPVSRKVSFATMTAMQ
jgi:hypothetical protein